MTTVQIIGETGELLVFEEAEANAHGFHIEAGDDDCDHQLLLGARAGRGGGPDLASGGWTYG